MMRELPPTLSEHLLEEARGFLLYPERSRRTKANRQYAEVWDKAWQRILEWRKTFAPADLADTLESLHAPSRLLDEVYCREQLKSISGMVERTRKLSHLTLSNIPEAESFVYLREAANCYIQGLPQAAIALARSAIESPIRQAAARLAGEDAVASEKFKAVIDRHGKRILSLDDIRLAHRVRIAANSVLHQRPSSSSLALQVIEDARAVVSELTKKAPKRRRKQH